MCVAATGISAANFSEILSEVDVSAANATLEIKDTKF